MSGQWPRLVKPSLDDRWIASCWGLCSRPALIARPRGELVIHCHETRASASSSKASLPGYLANSSQRIKSIANYTFVCLTLGSRKPTSLFKEIYLQFGC